MNKTDLVSTMAEAASITKAEATKAFDALIDGITNALKDADKVSIPGFGTFSVSLRASRTGRNPRTNETIEIPAKTVAKFKPGKALSDAVADAIEE